MVFIKNGRKIFVNEADKNCFSLVKIICTESNGYISFEHLDRFTIVKKDEKKKVFE